MDNFLWMGKLRVRGIRLAFQGHHSVTELGFELSIVGLWSMLLSFSTVPSLIQTKILVNKFF